MRRALLLVLATLAALLAPLAAVAHTRSESHSSWEIAGRTIRVTYSIPEIEVRKLSREAVSNERLIAYVRAKVYATAGDARCAVTDGPRAMAADPVFRRLQFSLTCPGAQPIVIHSEAFLDVAPNHMHFAQIQPADGDFDEVLFNAEQTSLDLSGGEGHALQSAGFLEYVKMGLMHIATGVDHMSFLLGLVLISRRTRDLVFVVTGFTIGHSLTLALAVTGIVRPHPEYIDALVALTIALVGAENVAVATHRPAVVALGVGGWLLAMTGVKLAGFGGLPAMITLGAAIFAACYLMISGALRDAGRLRLVVTLVFGLIHGFGFAANLLDMQLPKARLAELLVGFNLGVELGQLTFVLSIVGAVALLKRWRLALPRPIVLDVVSASLACVGVFWLIQRTYAS